MSSINIEYSTFDNFYASGIVASATELVTITNSNFANGGSIDFPQGGAIKVEIVTRIEVKNWVFENLLASYGGAIYFDT